ncbi:division/cell wall cluster transcriptional repressor MraZ [Candidatus Pelagibacter sp.]|nr:division/cell wall cluster transcriptional repressor MraZ [Candidatus Pelagibacter sp.]
MFLSTYENKLDKKGRVSVPASFRSHLSNLGYNGVICYPSFNNQAIEAWSQDRVEKISNSIDSLSPFEEKRDFFATSILSESINLQFDSEGRISLTSKLLKHAKIKNNILFVGQGKTFQIWEPTIFEKFKVAARKKANLNRANLKWEN